MLRIGGIDADYVPGLGPYLGNGGDDAVYGFHGYLVVGNSVAG